MYNAHAVGGKARRRANRPMMLSDERGIVARIFKDAFDTCTARMEVDDERTAAAQSRQVLVGGQSSGRSSTLRRETNF
jgi:hypothetical protein